MKKDDSITQKTAAVANDAPAAPENETVQQPAKAEEPAEAAAGEIDPADDGPIDEHADPTLVPVMVLVVSISPANDFLLLRHCLRSLRKNLRGVKAEVKVIGSERPSWIDCDTWLGTVKGDLNACIITAAISVKTERVIIMTDRMQLARPVSLADIALLKALPEGSNNKTVEWLYGRQGTTKHQVWNYDTHMPLYVFRTQLNHVVGFMAEENAFTEDLPTVYNNLLYPDLQPTLLDWATDGWLLPVVSAHPSMERMKAFLVKKKFIWISPNSEGAEVVALLKFLTPDAAPCETDCPNADPIED